VGSGEAGPRFGRAGRDRGAGHHRLLLLPPFWEASEGYYSYAGHELSVDASDDPGEDDYVQGYLVAATLLAAGLGLVPLLMSLVTRGRPLALAGLVSSIAAIAWIAFSIGFVVTFADELSMGFGLPVAWAAGAVMALGGAAVFGWGRAAAAQ